MIYKEIIIKNHDGLKAKVAANFVQVANQFESQILIEFTNKKINAKSIMGMMMLGISNGDQIQVTAEGADESEAIQHMEQCLCCAG